jgi:hypothetical protein
VRPALLLGLRQQIVEPLGQEPQAELLGEKAGDRAAHMAHPENRRSNGNITAKESRSSGHECSFLCQMLQLCFGFGLRLFGRDA